MQVKNAVGFISFLTIYRYTNMSKSFGLFIILFYDTDHSF